MNSSGSAMAENAKWLDSIEGKTFQLTNAMQALWNDTLNSEVIKIFYDVALAVTEATNKVGLLNAALVGVATYFIAIKKHKPMSVLTDGFNRLQNNLYASSQMLNIKNGFNAASGMSMTDYNSANINAYAAAVQGLTVQQQAAKLAAAGLNAEQIRSALITNGVTDAIASQTVAETNFVSQKNAALAVTKAQILSRLQEKGVVISTATQNWLLSDSYSAVTAEEIKAATAAGLVVAADEKVVLNARRVVSANTAVKNSMSGVGASIALMWKTNPLGLALTAFSIISSVAMLVAPLVENAFKSTSEKLQDLQTEWQEISDKISSSSKDFKQLKSSADSVIPRFSKLAKGVDKFGKNVNLTDAEYEEFLSLNNQLAEMFPEINNGMDENGNAMLSLSYNANTLEDSLLSLVDAKREAANEEIAAMMPDAAKNVKKTVKLYNQEKQALQSRLDAYRQAKESLDDFNTEAFKQQYKDLFGDDWQEKWELDASHSVDINMAKAAFGADEDIEGWNNLLDKFTTDSGIDWRGVLNSAEMQNAIAGVEVQFENVQAKIQNKWNQLNPIVSAWANTDYDYQGLDSDLQSAAQAMMGNIDFSKYDTADEIKDHITTDILQPLDDLTPEAQKKLSKLMSIDTKDLSVAEYQEKVTQAANEFAAAQDKWSASDILKNTGYQENLDAIDNIILKTEQLTDGKIKGEDLLTLDADQISKAFDVAKDYGIKSFDDLQKALDRKTFEVNIDITAEQEGFDALQTAIDEATSAAGMSAESIDKIEARYRDLAGYNHAEMFEETAHGIKLNASALRELEKEYNSSNADKLDAQLEDLTDQYNELSVEIATCTDASERANLYRQRQNVLDQINDTATLAAQYRGLASAYNQWQRLKGGSSNKDTYEGVVSGIKDMKEAMSDGWMDEWQKSFVDMFTNSDTSGWSTKQYVDEWTRLRTEVVGAGHTVMDFFTTDDDGNATSKGVYNLLEAIEATMPEVVKFKEETGEKYFDFSGVGDKAVAEAVGISEEVLHILLNAGKSTGIEVHLESAYTSLADFRDEATKVNERLKEIGATDYTFNINSLDINDVEEQIEEAKKALKNLFDENGKLIVDDSDLQNAKTLLATLIYQKQTLEQPAILKVNTENAHSGTEAIIKTLQEFKSAYNELEVKLSVGEDPTEAQAKLDEAISTLQGQAQGSGKEIMAKLRINPTQSEDDINTALLNITPKIMVEAGLNDQLIVDYQAETHTTEGEFIWNNNAKAVTDWMAEPKIVNGDVIWEDNTDALSTFFTAKGILNLTIVGSNEVNGTANAGGNWGAEQTETSLVGELGPEILVRGNRWTTIGENGAEFTQVKKGDIIFNHKQSEQLLKNGYITGRGRMVGGAFAYGTDSNIDSIGINNELEKYIHLLSRYSQDVRDAVNESSNVSQQMKQAGDQWNQLTNGNVDYNKRPMISPDKMRKYYPEFDGEVATTYSQYFTVGAREALYTIDITPILENGEVLTQKSLDEYVSSLVTTDGINGLLESDKNNLVIHVQPGDYDEEYWSNYQARLGEVKNIHWELAKQLTGGSSNAFWSLNEVAQNYGYTIDMLIKKLYNLKQESSNVTTVYTPNNPQSPGWSRTPGSSGRYAMLHGNAFAEGSGGASKTETALMAELGPEILVRGNQWTTIGDDGPCFAQVKKGDVIFNHKQTRELLKNGHTSSRGKIKGGNSAFAHGTAYAMAIGDTLENDNAYKKKLKKEIESIVDMRGGTRSDAVQIYNYNIGTATTMPDLVGHPPTGSSGSSSSSSDDGYGSNATPETTDEDIANDSGADDAGKDSGGGKGKDDDKDKETFDWIEVKLEEINEKIGLTEAKLENAMNLAEQNSILDELISIHQNLYDNLTAASDAYHAHAETLLAKIPEEYRAIAQDGTIKIEDGAIDLEDFAGEERGKILEAIQEYREWVQKAADATQQAEEVVTAIRDLAIQQFDNAREAGDVKVAIEDSQIEKLQNAVDFDEASGIITSDAYYIAMMKDVDDKIKLLTEAKNNMQKEFNDLMTSVPNFVGSNAYYEKLNEMYEMDSEIANARIELEEFQNAINDLDVERFDQLIARLDYVQKDTQNLIDLMSDEDMFVKPEGQTYEGGTVKFWKEEDVAWTDEGLATLGLYAQQMEVAKAGAAACAEQIQKLKDAYAAGGLSENEYLEQLSELTGQQVDFEKTAKDSWKAIHDLKSEQIDYIKQGIEKETEAYEELINKKKENLREDKNARDFQRSVSDKQKEIDDLERRIAVLSNNNSAWAKGELARLNAELAEKKQDMTDLYDDHALELEEKALDDSYESVKNANEAKIEELDKFLENYELVIEDTYTVIKANAERIGATLTETTEEYNLTVSDAVLSPWKDGAFAIGIYQEKFDAATSSTTSKLNDIRDAWQEVIDKTQEAGDANVAQFNKDNAAYTVSEQKQPVAQNKPTTTASGGGIYTVKRGDTLWGIAASKLGSGARWQEIYNLNKDVISNPDLIQPGWKLKLPKYAKGTTGIKNNQLAILDELGDELQLVPDGNGRLAYMTKGTSVIPHDITENLMTLGQLDPQDIIDRNRPVISAPHVSTNETVISIEYGDILHIDNYSGDKPENLSKLIDKAFDKHMKQLNSEIRKFTR